MLISFCWKVFALLRASSRCCFYHNESFGSCSCIRPSLSFVIGGITQAKLRKKYTPKQVFSSSSPAALGSEAGGGGGGGGGALPAPSPLKGTAASRTQAVYGSKRLKEEKEHPAQSFILNSDMVSIRLVRSSSDALKRELNVTATLLLVDLRLSMLCLLYGVIGLDALFSLFDSALLAGCDLCFLCCLLCCAGYCATPCMCRGLL